MFIELFTMFIDFTSTDSKSLLRLIGVIVLITLANLWGGLAQAQNESSDPQDQPAENHFIPPQGSELLIPPAPPELRVDPEPTSDLIPPSAQQLSPQDPLEVQIQRTQQLSLQEAMDLAVEQNPEIRAAELDLDISEAELDQIQATFAPTLSSTATYTLDDVGDPDSNQTERALRATLLDLEYDVIDPVRDARANSAEISVAIETLRLAQTIQQLRLTVAEAYFDLQRAEAQVLIEQGSVTQQQTNLADARDLEQAGLGTRFDVLSARANLADAETQLLAAQNDRRSRQRSLARLLSFQIPTDVIAAEPLQPADAWDLSLEETIVRALNRREELQIQQQLSEQAQVLAAQARAELDPTFSLNGSVFTSDITEVGDGMDLGYSIGATVNATWFDGGAAQAQARAAELWEAAAITQSEADADGIREEVELAFFQLQSNRDQIQASQTAVDQELRIQSINSCTPAPRGRVVTRSAIVLRSVKAFSTATAKPQLKRRSRSFSASPIPTA